MEPAPHAMTAPTILLVDDHPLFASAVADIVASLYPQHRVVVCDSFGTACAQVQREGPPQIVFLDLTLPDSPASHSLRRAREAFAPAPVVILSAHDDPARVRQALASGAAGFISKSLRPAEMTAAIAAALGGQPQASTGGLAGGPAPAGLSPRQAEVMELMAAGQTNKEIARSLGMAPGTVKVHVRDIFSRLGATTRTEAVALYQARLNGD